MAFCKSTQIPVLHIPRRILDIAAGKGLNPGFAGASIALDTHYYFAGDGTSITHYGASAHFAVRGEYVIAGGQFDSLEEVEIFLRTGDNHTAPLKHLSLAEAIAKVAEMEKEATDARSA